MAPTVEKPPKKAKGISKKGKKGWRKNVDIQKVEEYLDDKRLEERLGGSFVDRPDEALFVIEKDTTEKVEQPPKKWRKNRENKPLKCYQHLEIKGGVSDPHKFRNRRKTSEERRNPQLVEKEKTSIQNGVVKAKTKLQKKHRELEKLKKASTQAVLERTTRRRTEFDFDLWTGMDNEKIQVNKEIAGNDWLDMNTKIHNLNNTGNLQRNAPEDLLDNPSDLKAVEVPDAGLSYNPSLKDHQDLLWKAAIVEINKDKAEHKIEYHTTRMYPTSDKFPTKESWIKEMSEGVPGLDKDLAEEKPETETVEDEEEEEEEPKMFKPKTKTQRNREKREQYAKNKKITQDEDKKKFQDVFKLRSMRKEMNLDEKAAVLRSKVKEVKKIEKRSLPSTLGGQKYEEPEIPLKLGEELTGSLRRLKPEGNLLDDRFKSLQKRNVFETRIKKKVGNIKSKRIKKVEKRAYKMGFSWEKNKSYNYGKIEGSY